MLLRLIIDMMQYLAKQVIHKATWRTVAANSLISKFSSGAIAGIVIAVVAAVLSAGLAFLFYRRWKDALATHQDLYRVYALQQRGPPESSTAPPTGFSSSLETRSNASLLRIDNAAQLSRGRTQQPANNQGAVQISPGARDSRSIIGSVSSPPQSPVDEVCPHRGQLP